MPIYLLLYPSFGFLSNSAAYDFGQRNRKGKITDFKIFNTKKHFPATKNGTGNIFYSFIILHNFFQY